MGGIPWITSRLNETYVILLDMLPGGTKTFTKTIRTVFISKNKICHDIWVKYPDIRYNENSENDTFQTLLTENNMIKGNVMCTEWIYSNVLVHTVYFSLILWTDTLVTSSEFGLRWVQLNTIEDKWTLVQVMACFRQSTSYYMAILQCWPDLCHHVAWLSHSAWWRHQMETFSA